MILASLAEYAIFRLKRRIYMNMKSHLSDSWLSSLKKIVLNLNKMPNKGIGYLSPYDVANPSFDSKVFHAKVRQRALEGKDIYPESIKALKKRRQLYEKKKTGKHFFEGSYVYCDFPRDMMQKSTDFQRGITYALLSQVLKCMVMFCKYRPVQSGAYKTKNICMKFNILRQSFPNKRSLLSLPDEGDLIHGEYFT